jgi:SNF2 family DNA or RNA helicase
MLDMGLGKTVIALTALRALMYDYLTVGRALVIAPKRVAESTWTAEARKWDHLSLLRVRAVLGTEKQRVKALGAGADVYVVGRDNVMWLVERYRNAWPFDMVVCDEFSSFKNSQTKRFRALRRILPHITRLIGLTGTPAPNGLQDLWAQVYLLDGGARLGRTLTWYREQYFDFNPYTHTYTAKRGADAAVRAAIGDICVSMSARDYLDLPECVTVDAPVALDAAAAKAYKKLERDMLLDVDGDTIEAANAMALTNKLLQLCNGAMYGENNKVLHVHNCKADARAELVEGLNGQPALVFYSFRHDVPRIMEALRKAGIRRARELADERDIDAWNRGEADILIAHPASSAHGLNLQDGGRHIIWYGLPWALELYQQANKRLHRQGQKHTVIVHRLLVMGGADEDVAAALAAKGGAQDALLGALKARIAGVQK